MKDGKLVRKPLDYELTETVVEPVPHSDVCQVSETRRPREWQYLALIESRDMVQQKVSRQEARF